MSSVISIMANSRFALTRTLARSIRQYNASSSGASSSSSGVGVIAAAAAAAAATTAAAGGLLLVYCDSDQVVNGRSTTFLDRSHSYLNQPFDDLDVRTVTERMRALRKTSLTTLDDFKREFLRQLMIVQKTEVRDATDTRDATRKEQRTNIYDEDVESLKLLFPSLNVNLVNEKKGFLLNSRNGARIENELFVGKVLLVLRPTDPTHDEHYNKSMFSKSPIRFEIQIQGRLKYVPTEVLHCGAELLTDTGMPMNAATKGVARVLLGLLSKMIGSNMGYSFGTDQERPFISFPLVTAMDTLVVTRSGETVPRMGSAFYESDESIHTRKSGKDIAPFNTDDVYSMSFGSNCIDLPTWSIVSPLHVNLSRFWGDALLRLVIYEEATCNNNNKYLFEMQFQHLPKEAIAESKSITDRIGLDLLTSHQTKAL